MGRKMGRSAEDTRRHVLGAAAEVVRRHGVATSLDVIARDAGVSKGGVLYHFAGKDALLLTLAAEILGGFREQVYAAIDEPEGSPGRLTRAYVRANLAGEDGDEDGRVARERIALIAQLLTLPAVLELATADDRRWERELADDGVPSAVRNLVVAAADGFATRVLWNPVLDEAARDRLEADLLAMVDAAVGR